jgi:hypothetical protein
MGLLCNVLGHKYPAPDLDRIDYECLPDRTRCARCGIAAIFVWPLPEQMKKVEPLILPDNKETHELIRRWKKKQGNTGSVRPE